MQPASAASDRYGHVSRSLYRAGWFEAARQLARLLPRSVLRALAAALGTLYALLSPAKMRVLRHNLALIVPGAATPALCCRTCRNFARTLADYFYLAGRTKAEAFDLIGEKSGYDYLVTARAPGRGALLLTAHLSFFELGGLMTELGFPTVALSLPEPNAALSRWRADYRRRWAVDTIQVGEDAFAFTAIRHALARGLFVAVLIDRPPSAQGVRVQLPGGTLTCSGGILYLAMLTGCPVVAVAITEQANGQYRLEARPPLSFEGMAPTPENLQIATQRVMDDLAPIIAAHPDQWFQFAPLE